MVIMANGRPLHSLKIALELLPGFQLRRATLLREKNPSQKQPLRINFI
jgi:hypothetical protein